MENNEGLTEERLPADEGSSASVASADAAPVSFDLRRRLSWNGGNGDWQNWLVWLAAGAVILGVVGCGILLFVILNAGTEQKTTSTPSLVAVVMTPNPTTKRAPSGTPTVTMTPTMRPTATATPRPTITPTPTDTPTPTPDVILLGVKALGELNTVAYNLKTVVEKDVQQRGPLLLRPGLHFLLVAEGNVKAGVDFAEFVRYEIVGDRVTVYLPAPRITEYAVDPASVEIYYINTGFGLDEKFAIEKYNEAVLEAQESLRRAALDSDILEAAKANAKALVQSLVLGLGFSEVEVAFVPRGDETDLLEGPLELPITPAPFATATPGS